MVRTMESVELKLKPRGSNFIDIVVELGRFYHHPVHHDAHHALKTSRYSAR